MQHIIPLTPFLRLSIHFTCDNRKYSFSRTYHIYVCTFCEIEYKFEWGESMSFEINTELVYVFCIACEMRSIDVEKFSVSKFYHKH